MVRRHFRTREAWGKESRGEAYIEAADKYRTEENAKEFDEAYNIGLAGETLDGFAPDADITSMTKAYMAGVHDKAAFRERTAQRTTFNATRKGLSSDNLTETLIKRYSGKTKEVLQNLGEALGVQIKLVTNSGIAGHEMDSYYDSKSGVIAINVNEVHRNPKIKTKTKDGSLSGDDLIRFVAAHEGIHRIRETSPKAYAQMEKIALSKSKVTVSEYMKKHGVSEAIAKEEITADYFGDLLTNKAEIKALLNKNRGLFDIIREVLEKIGNALRKAGIDFAEIAEARRLFREALKEADSSVWGKDVRSGGEVNFSISEIIAEDGTNYGMGVYLDSNLLTGLTEKERIQMVKEFVKELGGNEFIAYDKNKSAIKIRIAEHSKRFKNKSGNSIRVNKDLVSYLNNKVKQEAIVLIDELIANSDYDYSSKAKYSHGWVDDGGKNPWDYWKVFIQEKNKTVWEATLNVANTANGEKILYDIYPIKMVEQSVTSDTSTTKDNISQKSDGVNTYSMQDSKKDAGVLFSRSEEAFFTDKEGNIKKAEELTETDFRDLLEKVQQGQFNNGTYIPMRASTPEFFIDVVREHSEGKINVMQVPMAAEVKHIRQNMEEEEYGISYGNARPHNFSVDDVVTISKEMGHPAYIVLQKNGRYAMVVSFHSKTNKKVAVSIAFANEKGSENYKYQQYMNGYNEGYYNIIVTQYEPDSLSNYLKNNEVVYDKMKMNGRYQVGSGRIVTFTHDTPFIDNSIPDNDKFVKNESSDKIRSRSEDGTKYFPKGEAPRRDIDVPSEIGKKKVMRGARTAAEAPGVSEEVAEDIPTEIENGRFFYTPSVNALLMANAQSRVSEDYDEAMAAWLKVVGGGRVRDVDIALGEALIIETSKRGDAKKTMDLICDLAILANEAGKAVQAMRLLKRMSPEGQLMYINKVAETITDKRSKDKGKKFEASEEQKRKVRKFEEATRNAEADVKAKEKTVSDLEGKIEALTDLVETENEVSAMDEEIKALKRELFILKSEIKKQNADKDKLSSEIDFLEKQIAEQSEMLLDAIKIRDSILSERGALSKELNAIKREAKSADEASGRILAEIEILESDISDASKKLDVAKKFRDELTEERKKLGAERRTLIEKTKLADKASEKDLKRISELNNEIMDLSDKLEVASKNAEDAAEVRRMLVDERNRLKGKLERAENAISRENGKAEKYKKDILELLSGLKAADEALAEAKAKREVAKSMEERAKEAAKLLFNDAESVEYLVKNRQSMAGRFFDFLSHYSAKLTGNDEKATVLQARRLLSQALRESEDMEGEILRSAQNDNVGGWSIKRDKNGKAYWHIDTGKDIFAGIKNASKIRDKVFDYILGEREKTVIIDHINDEEIRFIRVSAEEFTGSDESQALFDEAKKGDTKYQQKMRMFPSLQDLIDNATTSWDSPDMKEHKLFKEKGFKNYRGRVGIDNVIFSYVVRVGKAKFGNVFYDINLEVDSYLPHSNDTASDIKNESTSKNSIARKSDAVNTYSMQDGGSYSIARKSGATMEQAQKLFNDLAYNGELTDAEKLREIYKKDPSLFGMLRDVVEGERTIAEEGNLDYAAPYDEALFIKGLVEDSSGYTSEEVAESIDAAGWQVEDINKDGLLLDAEYAIICSENAHDVCGEIVRGINRLVPGAFGYSAEEISEIKSIWQRAYNDPEGYSAELEAKKAEADEWNVPENGETVSERAETSIEKSLKKHMGIEEGEKTPHPPQAVPLPLEGKAQKSIDEREKIYPSMPDDERAKVISNKKISLVKAKDTEINADDLAMLEKAAKGNAQPILIKIAEQFGVMKKYYNAEIDMDFNMSKSTIKESAHYQKGSYDTYAKMLSVFDDVVEGAKGIEVHKDIYADTIREDKSLEYIYVFASAFYDGDSIIPVQMNVKVFKDKDNTIRLIVSFVNKREASDRDDGRNGINHSLPLATKASDISIADLVKLVNPEDGDFLKYFPDSMLTEEQIEGKKKALIKQQEKIARLKQGIRSEAKSIDEVTAEMTAEHREMLKTKSKADFDALKGTEKLKAAGVTGITGSVGLYGHTEQAIEQKQGTRETQKAIREVERVLSPDEIKFAKLVNRGEIDAK